MTFNRRTLFLGAAAGSAAGAGNAPRNSAPGAVGRRFTGEALREIAFPLGGLGTGTVSLGGYGNLRDWEIFNRPGKGCNLPFTFAALRLAGPSLQTPTARVLEREVLPPFTASHGIGRERAAGLARFREAVFTGGYPIATVDFQDAAWPAEVALEAFNPMIPLDLERSSLPVAILTYSVKSRAPQPLEGTLAFSITNAVGYDRSLKFPNRRAACFGGNRNAFRSEGGLKGIFCTSSKYPADSFRYGSMALATDAAEVSYRTRWEHGAWWDELPAWWREFTAAGRFPNNESPESEDGFTEYATLAAHFRLRPGATERIRFVLAWHFPNIEDYWTGQKPYFIRQRTDPKRLLRNQYGTRWRDAWEAAAHALREFEPLHAGTRAYRDALYGSTLPPEVIDAVSSQASIARTNTLLVAEGNVPLGFEGCGDDEGCCPFNCTHVYNYEQTLAHLYPQLERKMREIDFVDNLRDDGHMGFRTATPVQHGAYTKIPAADGQMGSILKLYREWSLSGDEDFLRKLWPGAKKALEFAWTHWDRDRDGVMEGEQHNTYDIKFYGPNSMVGTLYLGALAAAARMGRHLHDPAAEDYDRLFAKGAEALDRLLWNGDYYIQKTDEREAKASTWQFGEGCLSDQLLGQWFAELLGLGKLLPHEHIRKCLDAIMRYNFRQNFHDYPSGQRIYALNDERGLVVCSWPRGKRPAVPFGYCDEVWTGVEYQVAGHLFYEGRLEEGLRIVRGVRDRHDGRRRNPWDEVECGHHYARAMSSWSLLTGLSGCRYFAPGKELSLRPRLAARDFRSFFSAGPAWGVFGYRRTPSAREVRVEVKGGALELAAVELPALAAGVQLRGAAGTVERSREAARIVFANPVRLAAGQHLAFSLTAPQPPRDARK